MSRRALWIALGLAVLAWLVTLWLLLALQADVREACGGVVAKLDLTEWVGVCR